MLGLTSEESEEDRSRTWPAKSNQKHVWRFSSERADDTLVEPRSTSDAGSTTRDQSPMGKGSRRTDIWKRGRAVKKWERNKDRAL
jgi:hypothetical protein